jgi:hypothetical protein
MLARRCFFARDSSGASVASVRIRMEDAVFALAESMFVPFKGTPDEDDDMLSVALSDEDGMQNDESCRHGPSE